MYRTIHENGDYSDFSGGITHPEEEQTEFVSFPSRDDVHYSPNDSLDTVCMGRYIYIYGM